MCLLVAGDFYCSIQERRGGGGKLRSQERSRGFIPLVTAFIVPRKNYTESFCSICRTDEVTARHVPLVGGFQQAADRRPECRTP